MTIRPTPGISAIIVAYQPDHVLSEVIFSLADSRTTLPFEIIVVDNASPTEFSLPHIDRPARLVRLSENMGVAEGWNRGAEFASYDTLLFMSSDYYVAPHTIAKLREALDDDPRLGVVAPAILENSKGVAACISGYHIDLWRVKVVPIVCQPHSVQVLACDSVNGSMMLCRRTCYDDVGGYDPRFFLHYEDHDFCQRARQSGWSIAVVRDAGGTHAAHGSTSRFRDLNLFWHRQSRLRMVLKHGKWYHVVSHLACVVIELTSWFIRRIFSPRSSNQSWLRGVSREITAIGMAVRQHRDLK